MMKSEGIGQLAASLAKAQGVMKHAVKDSSNPFFKSTYADLASVWEAARNPLSDNGLSIVQTLDSEESAVVIETTLLHESGEWISGRVAVTPAKTDAQGYGAVISYMRRYSLSAIIGGYADDDDAETDRQEHTKKTTITNEVPEEIKKPGETPKNSGKELSENHKKLWHELNLYCGDNKEKIASILHSLTTWEKDGKVHEGKDSIYDISEAMAKVTIGKLRKMVEDEGRQYDQAEAF